MTTPAPTSTTDQILIKLGEMGIQLAHIEEQVKPISGHEKRIRSLEDSRARMFGVVVSVSVACSAGGTWLGLIIAHH